MSYYENSKTSERAVLLGVDDGSYDAESSMEELRLLAESAGAQTVATVLQRRPAPDPALHLGAGRLEETRLFCETNDIDLLIVDGELPPIRRRNIETFTSVRTIDRTELILDIFAGRAKSREGKIQVELAQLKYRLPRLTGQGTSLSRLGGGIGTRGPGETQLETDRRHIRRRIHTLEEELKTVGRQRELRRKKRRGSGIVTAAVVGYTNAGKSTLLNTLTHSDVPAQDMLFATLDPTSRQLVLPHGRKILLTDTVGFVSRLPHSLVEAFRSTLEEASEADLLLNVCDASSPELDDHLTVTDRVLTELGCADKPMITVLNKCDKCDRLRLLPFSRHTVQISALTGEGIDRLLGTIEQLMPDPPRRVELLIPYADSGVCARVRQCGYVLREEYGESGIRLTADLEPRYADAFLRYLVPFEHS